MTYRERKAMERTECPRCQAGPGEWCIVPSGCGTGMRDLPHAARVALDTKNHPLGGARRGAGRKATGPTDEARVQLPGPRVSRAHRAAFLAICRRWKVKPAQLFRAVAEALVTPTKTVLSHLVEREVVRQKKG